MLCSSKNVSTCVVDQRIGLLRYNGRLKIANLYCISTGQSVPGLIGPYYEFDSLAGSVDFKNFLFFSNITQIYKTENILLTILRLPNVHMHHYFCIVLQCYLASTQMFTSKQNLAIFFIKEVSVL